MHLIWLSYAIASQIDYVKSFRSRFSLSENCIEHFNVKFMLHTSPTLALLEKYKEKRWKPPFGIVGPKNEFSLGKSSSSTDYKPVFASKIAKVDAAFKLRPPQCYSLSETLTKAFIIADTHRRPGLQVPQPPRPQIQPRALKASASVEACYIGLQPNLIALWRPRTASSMRWRVKCKG